ncbi:MAG: hypothetical protein ACREQ4_10500 [Candidatus Binataceae bacterium]
MKRLGRRSRLILLLIPLVAWATPDWAQSVVSNSPAHPNGFLQLANPEKFTLTIYGGGFVSDEYGVTQEGFQFEQSVTRYIGVVGRVTGYQLYIGHGFDNPLVPGTGYHARYNFGRFQAGLDLQPFAGTNLYLLGGADAGDSSAGVAEGDFSTWAWMRSRHSVNLAVSAIYDSQNQVTSSEVDLRTIVYSNEKLVLLAGGGGALYAGGFVHGVDGQGGPLLGFYFPGWRFGLDAQAGYGSSRQYGQLSLYKQFSWTE